MAITKNTAPAKVEAPAAKAAAKKVAPASKTATAAKPAPVKAAAKPAVVAKAASVAKEEAPKISRKELALAIRAKVVKSGAAVSPKVAEICTVAYEEAIAEALAAGQEVHLPGFGKFLAVAKEAGEKRNPSNGEMVMVAAHKQIKFRVGAKFKQSVNGGVEQAEAEEAEEAEESDE